MAQTVAIPGQLLGPCTQYIAGPGTHIHESNLYSSLLGTVSLAQPEKAPGPAKRMTKITPREPAKLPTISVSRSGLSEKREVLPDVGNVVLCRVTRINPRQATVAILVVGESVLEGEWQGIIRAQDICPVDPFFYQISPEYSPSRQDPRLQTAGILACGLKLEEGSAHAAPGLFYLLWPNFTTALAGGRLADERAILERGMRHRHVLAFMLGKMLPAVVAAAVRCPDAWALAQTYVDALEARLAGADTVLLIVKMLDADLLARLYRYSLDLGMEPLVEVQNADEMHAAVALGARVIGVNNRNLESFEVDIGTTGRLRGLVPKDTVICALSGILTHDDVVANHRDGVNAVLVGEAIMRAPDASHFIRELCAGPEAAAAAAAAQPKPEPLLVKVCGTRTVEGALAAAEAGADMIGMILVPGRKRTVDDETAQAISAAIHSFSRATPTTPSSTVPADQAVDFFATAASKLARPNRPLLVGVFLDQPLAEVQRLQARYALDVVQLHGAGDAPEWASAGHIPVPVVRRFAPGEPGIGVRGCHAAPLLDSGSAGGSGTMLDAVAVRAALRRDSELRVLLAGGLGPDNVAAAIAAVGKPEADRILGVDASSGLEDADGRQSPERIREFVRAAKAVR